MERRNKTSKGKDKNEDIHKKNIQFRKEKQLVKIEIKQLYPCKINVKTKSL
jgi:hypothetical protein